MNLLDTKLVYKQNKHKPQNSRMYTRQIQTFVFFNESLYFKLNIINTFYAQHYKHILWSHVEQLNGRKALVSLGICLINEHFAMWPRHHICESSVIE